MSDIPDWLVELAAQRNQSAEEEADEPAAPAAFEPEADALDLMETLRSQVDEELPEEEPEPAPRGLFGRGPRAQSPAAEAVPEGAVAAVEPARQPRPVARVAGLLPWQQLVLAVLVFLDVVVIGLLFLVMLGRVAIP